MPDTTDPIPTDLPILVDFPDESGLVEASLAWPNREKLEEWGERSEAALTRAMDTIANMAQRTAELRQRVPREFTKAEVTFGVKLDYKAGALLTQGGAEGSITVKLTWERKEEEQ
jgi:hypothetical protein